MTTLTMESQPPLARLTALPGEDAFFASRHHSSFSIFHPVSPLRIRLVRGWQIKRRLLPQERSLPLKGREVSVRIGMIQNVCRCLDDRFAAIGTESCPGRQGRLTVRTLVDEASAARRTVSGRRNPQHYRDRTKGNPAVQEVRNVLRTTGGRADEHSGNFFGFRRPFNSENGKQLTERIG